MNGTQYGGFILDVLGGVGALLVGIGIFVACLALSKTLTRVRTTLDGVDRQLEGIGTPMTSTLAHVDEAARSLEETAGKISRTTDLTKNAVTPVIVNVGATLSGVTAGVRRLLTGKDARD